VKPRRGKNYREILKHGISRNKSDRDQQGKGEEEGNLEGKRGN